MAGAISICFAIFLCLNQVSSLSILALFPYEGKSHFFVFEPLLKELVARGHSVTVVSHFPQKEPIKNYHDISLAGKVKILEDVFPMEKSYTTLMNVVFFVLHKGSENCRKMLENEQVQDIWRNKQKFDLVLTEQFNSDCSIGLAYHIGAPVVGITSCVLMPMHYKRFGIAYNPSYVPFLLLEGGTKPTLFQRLERTLLDAYFSVVYKYYQYRDTQTLTKYFGETPNLEELSKDIKMMLLYQNFVLTGSRLLPANVKEVGGFHVAKPKPLPNDLKKFLDEAKYGVIYISFGSMLKPTSIAKEKLDAILGALSELPQRVIWKWEDKTLAVDSKKFYLSHWLPQNDILAHPNILAFYSHCGLLGTTEAIYHGVPIVAMPIFGDQPANAASIEESGLGIQIQLANLTKENLLTTLKRVLSPEFRNNVKLVSKAWHDQPVKPMDSAVHWIEFAARHHHFSYRSPAADVPLYQYLCLDILSIFTAIIIGICYIAKLLLCSKKSKLSETIQNKANLKRE